jgi:hypothetical protein
MRLSEAIRLGAMLGSQARGSLNRQRRKYVFFGPVVNEYCALGGAFAASGAKPVWHVRQSAGVDDHASSFRGSARTSYKAGDTYLVIEHQFSAFMHRLVACPVCGFEAPLFKVIPTLNDDHRWTREQIADWVQTIEEANAAKAAQPDAVTVEA